MDEVWSLTVRRDANNAVTLYRLDDQKEPVERWDRKTKKWIPLTEPLSDVKTPRRRRG